jgi:hypothetical protein
VAELSVHVDLAHTRLPVPLGRGKSANPSRIRLWRSIGVCGSLSPDCFRARPIGVTDELGHNQTYLATQPVAIALAQASMPLLRANATMAALS